MAVRLVTWDSGVSWDDVNLRWGDPSYLLEPGDPGYVADPTSASFPPSQPKTRKNTMPKSDYLKRKDAQFAAQLNTFKNNIGAYATLLGVSPAQVSAQAADADYFNYVLACQEIMANGSQQWTAWKDLVRLGGTPPASGMPVAPTFPAAVAAVALGIQVRFRALVKQCKGSANYNVAIGEALGIEGAAQTGPDFATLKPTITLELTGAGVMIRWGWEGNAAFLDFIEIAVDRGDGKGFVTLTFDSTPDYLDTTPFPATAAKWAYKAVYRVDEQRAGLWSDVASITVAA